MIKIGMISNPRSQKNKRGFADLQAAVADQPDLPHAVLDNVTEIPDILADFARREVGLLVVAGGDGTVQAVMTALYHRGPYETPPALAILPRGMTNMMAGDVGLRQRGLRGLAKLIARNRDGGLERSLVRRHLVKMENARGQGPQYGMFFGGAGIYRAIQACRNNVHPWKLEAEVAAGLTMAGLMGRWLFLGGRGDKVIRGDAIGLTLDQEELARRNYLLVLATTLDRLILGSRPFWNGGADSGYHGGLRFTAIAFPPDRIAWHARRVLYGGETRNLPAASYLSRPAEKVELQMDCPFTLDGELFEPEAGRPIVLSGGAEATFARV